MRAPRIPSLVPVLLLAVAGTVPGSSAASGDAAPSAVHGAAGAGPPAPDPSPLAATYASLASFPGRFALGDPWSPTRQLLVFNAPEGLSVLDAAQPGSSPRVLTEQRPFGVTWSPDGTWVACRVRTAEEARRGLWSLIVAPTDGRPALLLLERQDFGSFVWGSDGFLYTWDKETGERHRADPPAAWRAENPGAFAPRPRLVWTRPPAAPGRDHFLFDAAPDGIRQRSLGSYRAGAGVQVSVSDAFPGGDRFLVRIFGRVESPYDLVLGPDGETLVDFRGTDPLGTFLVRRSVASDGRYLAGFHTVDDGHEILAAQLWLVDPEGAWRTPIGNAPPGVEPFLSHAGHLLAFESFPGGAIHVGRLRFADR